MFSPEDRRSPIRLSEFSPASRGTQFHGGVPRSLWLIQNSYPIRAPA
ncbi:MAG: hypothetical protein AAGE59_26930 [Cyanobacteria bacterium P01_F01_bin.86]